LPHCIASKKSKQTSNNKTRISVNLATGFPNLKMVWRLGAGHIQSSNMMVNRLNVPYPVLQRLVYFLLMLSCARHLNKHAGLRTIAIYA